MTDNHDVNAEYMLQYAKFLHTNCDEPFSLVIGDDTHAKPPVITFVGETADDVWRNVAEIVRLCLIEFRHAKPSLYTFLEKAIVVYYLDDDLNNHHCYDPYNSIKLNAESGQYSAEFSILCCDDAYKAKLITHKIGVLQ